MKALFRPPRDKLVETLGITTLSKSQVSVTAKELDRARHPRPRHRSEKDEEHGDTQAARLV